MRGGGKGTPKADAITNTKINLARLFLSLGCELQQTTRTVEQLLKQSGIPAIKHALRQRDPAGKLTELEKLAVATGITLPKLNTAELKRNQSNQNRQNRLQLRMQDVSAADYVLAPGVAQNADGSKCPIIDTIKHAATGVIFAYAEPWLRQTTKLSQDELALLILGGCNQGKDEACTTYSIPATTTDGSPVILSVCMHQLGNKQVQLVRPKGAKVDMGVSTVCAVTVFKDEVDQQTWSDLLHAPVKVALELLARSHGQVAPIVAPWGRSWFNQHGKCTPQQAKSLQFHMRLQSDQVETALRASGMTGAYCVPKTEKHEIDQDFAIIWMDQDLATIRVTAAACSYGMGLVRVTRGPQEKTSLGIRVKAKAFSDAHQALKPQLDIPVHIQIHHIAKIAPLPLGVIQESLKTWLTQAGLQAKPLKPFGSKAWLLGFQEKIQEQWLSWNNTVVLIEWAQEKKLQHAPPVLAGRLPKTDKQISDATDPWMHEDPWTKYRNRQDAGVAASSHRLPVPPNVAANNAAPRVTEGPIEERFKTQDAKMEKLQRTMEEMSTRMDQQEQHAKTLESNIKTQVNQIQTDVTSQVGSLVKIFEDSLQRAMNKQDKQLQDSFDDLKTMITQQTAKKVRVAGNEDEEDKML